MRVTFITHYGELYGANRSLLNLLDGLRKMGVVPSVICRKGGPMVEELERRNIPFCVIPFELWLSPPQSKHTLKGVYRFLNNLRLLPAMIQQVKRWQAEVIYSNSSVTPVGALIAKLMFKPHIWHVREFGKLDYDLRHDLGSSFFRCWMNQAAAVIAISQSIKDVVLGEVHGRIHIIYNGVVTAGKLKKTPAEPLPPLKEVESGPTFVIAGLIHPPKGQREAIEAFALVHRKHPEAVLLIAGSGDQEYVRQLQDLTYKLGIVQSVHFLGFIHEINALFNRVDAVLMCSRFEGMGRVTAEAMAAGKPVIGYNSAGTAELIVHGKTGLLYEGGVENLAACMESLIESPGLAYELGTNARNKAKEEFTVEVYAGKVFHVLQSVAGKT